MSAPPTAHDVRPARPGLSAERTTLAWRRTGLALLVNGALLMVRSVHTGRLSALVIAGAAALVLAVLALVTARHRTRVLARRPLPRRIAMTAHVQVLGYCVAVLTVVTGVFLVLGNGGP